MAEKKLIKLEELEYNEQVTLAIVEKDKDLIKIFMDDSKEKSFILLRQLVKNNLLKPESKESLRGIFDLVISVTPQLIDDYKRLLNNGVFEVTFEGENADMDIPLDKPIPTFVEPVVEKTAEIVTAKIKVEKKAKVEGIIELPRRYGKEKIMADIQAQGGKATPLQNAMLKVNLMKNTYVNLNARLIKDMFLSERILTDEDYRTINSVIMIMERKLEDIIKKK